MPASGLRLEAKVTLARVISVAYEHDSGFVAALQAEKGPFSVTMDSKGEITLKGEAGVLSFQTTQKERARIGLRLQRLEATFRQTGDHSTFSLSCRLGGVSVSVSGGVKLDSLMKACSGFLCRAARVVNVDDRWFDKEAEKAFLPN